MRIQAEKERPNIIPDPLFCIYQFIGLNILSNADDRMLLAKDRFKKLLDIINVALEKNIENIDLDTHIQLTVFLSNFINNNRTNTDEKCIPFFPNFFPGMEYKTTEFHFSFTKDLVAKKFISLEGAMILESKFIFGIGSRVYDGLPVKWLHDATSLVSFLEILSWLKINVKSEKFDIMAHTSRPKKKYKNVFLENTGERPEEKGHYLNIPTLICGKYDNSSKKKNKNVCLQKSKVNRKNFIIQQGGCSFDTINRRFEGIHGIFYHFFNDIIKSREFKDIPQSELIKYFIDNKNKIHFGNKKRDCQINREIIDIVYDYVKLKDKKRFLISRPS
jgi:hypothetical protein